MENNLMKTLTINEQVETIGGDLDGVGNLVQVILDLLNGRIPVYV